MSSTVSSQNVRRISLRNLVHKRVGIPSEKEKLSRQFQTLQGYGVEADDAIGLASEQLTREANITLGFLENLLSIDRFPTLILESDCVPSSDWKEEVLVPFDGMALYLGVSRWGIVSEDIYLYGVRNNVIAHPVENGLCRIRNMLSAHAIMILNEEGRQAFIAACLKALEYRLITDICFAQLQLDHAIFAYPTPLYYQCEDLNGREASTIKPLNTNVPRNMQITVRHGEDERTVYQTVRGENITWKGSPAGSANWPVISTRAKASLALKQTYVQECEAHGLSSASAFLQRYYEF